MLKVMLFMMNLKLELIDVEFEIKEVV